MHEFKTLGELNFTTFCRSNKSIIDYSWDQLPAEEKTAWEDAAQEVDAEVRAELSKNEDTSHAY